MTELSLATPKSPAEPGRLRRLFRWLAGDLRAALAILVLLVLVIVSSLIVVPLMSYAISVLRANHVLGDRTVRAEAGFFLTEFVPPESLSVLHIYFPDPWPKSRHNKRRLIQPKLVAQLTSRLAPPITVTAPTPRTFSKRFLMLSSVSVVKSRRERVGNAAPLAPPAGLRSLARPPSRG